MFANIFDVFDVVADLMSTSGSILDDFRPSYISSSIRLAGAFVCEVNESKI